MLRALITESGPISVERFMGLALGDPRHGYYMTREPFGASGDFTTAPEISQMFGELLGLWSATMWHAMGSPSRFRLVELGPGRGTLLVDAVRAARALPAFRAALDVHLVETSPRLQAIQERTLNAAGLQATWHSDVEGIPDGPAVVLANEFFDALPIRQFLRMPHGVYERLVGLAPDGQLCFGLAPDPITPLRPVNASEGGENYVFERGLIGEAIMDRLARRLTAYGGALLVIDYGYMASGPGETLQAVRRHAFVDALSEPGEADITAHVDFAALARAAHPSGARVYGPVHQGAFLRGLGLEQRAATLTRTASPAQATAISTALERLAGPAPGMGDLFKVLAVTHPALPPPPGFPSETKP